MATAEKRCTCGHPKSWHGNGRASCAKCTCEGFEPISRPVMNSPADEAEARDRVNTAPLQADPAAQRRSETGASSGSEARPVTPTEQLSSKPLCDLLYSFEMVLTEMRTHALPGGIVREWVARLDRERDCFASITGKSPETYCADVLRGAPETPQPASKERAWLADVEQTARSVQKQNELSGEAAPVELAPSEALKLVDGFRRCESLEALKDYALRKVTELEGRPAPETGSDPSSEVNSVEYQRGWQSGYAAAFEGQAKIAQALSPPSRRIKAQCADDPCVSYEGPAAAMPSNFVETGARKWPGEPPHCPNCECGVDPGLVTPTIEIESPSALCGLLGCRDQEPHTHGVVDRPAVKAGALQCSACGGTGEVTDTDGEKWPCYRGCKLPPKPVAAKFSCFLHGDHLTERCPVCDDGAPKANER